MATRATTEPVVGSTRSTLPDWVTTQSEPSASCSSQGVASNDDVAAILFVAGSIRSSRAPAASATHTDPPASAMPQGCPPVGIFATTWVGCLAKVTAHQYRSRDHIGLDGGRGRRLGQQERRV